MHHHEIRAGPRTLDRYLSGEFYQLFLARIVCKRHFSHFTIGPASIPSLTQRRTPQSIFHYSLRPKELGIKPRYLESIAVCRFRHGAIDSSSSLNISLPKTETKTSGSNVRISSRTLGLFKQDLEGENSLLQPLGELAGRTYSLFLLE